MSAQQPVAEEIDRVIRAMHFAEMRITDEKFITLFAHSVPMPVLEVAQQLSDEEFRCRMESAVQRIGPPLLARLRLEREINNIITGLAFAECGVWIGSVLDALIDLDADFVRQALEEMTEKEFRITVQETVSIWEDGE